MILTANVGQANAEGFTDVKTGADKIMYLSNEGIINGYGDGRFGPNDTVTRAQAALMIARALDLDTKPRDTDFPDVNITHDFSGAVQSAADLGIIQGSNGKFNPFATVDRGQMALIIARAFELKEEEVISFSDISINTKSYSAIRKLLAAGVTEGYTDGTFKPSKKLTRSEFSSLLARALNPADKNFKLPVNVCGYEPKSKKQDRQTVNCLLTREALKVGIPPEIVKSVATKESGQWKQFNLDGTPVMAPDGGIGLMQITTTAGYNVDLLKSDLAYNIYAGVEMLNTNFINKNLPSIGEMKREELQSWYFAVMAYNGIKPKNSPLYQDSGLTNTVAYQEGVFSLLYSAYELSNVNLSPKGMRTTDFQYDKNSTANINFQKMHYEVAAADRILSKEMFEAGDDTARYDGRLRPSPGTSLKELANITSKDQITILGGLVYDEKTNSPKTFAWYPVKAEQNGKTYYGYIASKYIK
nr:S-layer homology domain-containing protein [Paenisporosarcina quisquiliarum]